MICHVFIMAFLSLFKHTVSLQSTIIPGSTITKQIWFPANLLVRSWVRRYIFHNQDFCYNDVLEGWHCVENAGLAVRRSGLYSQRGASVPQFTYMWPGNDTTLHGGIIRLNVSCEITLRSSGRSTKYYPPHSAPCEMLDLREKQNLVSILFLNKVAVSYR